MGMREMNPHINTTEQSERERKRERERERERERLRERARICEKGLLREAKTAKLLVRNTQILLYPLLLCDSDMATAAGRHWLSS